jgi:phage shock protein PspC (stress-responsive transcriptional regulator)
MNERLYRSRDDRIIAGVAGGLADQLNVDPSLVRILWVLLLFPTAGLALLLYVVMAFVVPEEPVSGFGPIGGPVPTGAASPPAAAGGSDAASAPLTSTSASGAPGTSAPGVPAPGVASSPVAGSDWRSVRHAEREARRAERHARRGDSRQGFGALLFGLILILVGGYYLVRAWIPAIDVDRAWPVLLVVIGVVLLFGSIRRSPNPPG